MFGFLQNNAFTKPGGFSKNVNMPLLLAGMGMMSNQQNPMAGGLQGLLGGIQYKQQQAQQAQRLKQQQQQYALQQKRFNMQQQQFNQQQAQYKQQQAQQAKWNNYITNSGLFTPQQQARLQAVPMAQGVTMAQNMLNPPAGKTAKLADGYMYWISGPKQGQRVNPNIQQAPAPAFAGNGMQQQAASKLLELQNKIQSGQQLTKSEQMQYNLVQQVLQRPQVISTPEGTNIVPGINVSQVTGSQPAAQASGVSSNQSPYGFTAKKATEGERLSATYADRMEAAERSMQKVRKGGYDPASTWEHTKAGVPLLGNHLASEEYQLYRQGQENWVTANLRKESGAAIPPEEMDREIDKYFPIPGDSEAVIKQKAEARNVATAGMRRAAGDIKPQADPGAPSVTQVNGMNLQQLEGLSDDDLNKMTPEELQGVLKRLEGMEGAK